MTDTPTPDAPPRTAADLAAEIAAMTPELRQALLGDALQAVGVQPAPPHAAFEEALKPPAQRGVFTTAPSPQSTTGTTTRLVVDGEHYEVKPEIPGGTMAAMLELYAAPDRNQMLGAIRPILREVLVEQAWHRYEQRTLKAVTVVRDGAEVVLPMIPFPAMTDHALYLVDALIGRPTGQPPTSG
jgi:hypothetical protein